MSETTHRAVQAAWAQTGAAEQYPTPSELETATQAEAERLDELIGNLTQQIRDKEIASFRQANQGNHPPFLETVQIGNRARAQATEVTLSQELGETVELAESEESEELEDQSWRASPHRWRTHTHLLDDPTPEIDALTDDVWPEQALRFRVMAAYLMQTRYEDSEPIPETADDPLKAQFTALVEAEVAHSETVLSEFRRMNPSS